MPVIVPSAEDMPLRRKQKEINKKQKNFSLNRIHILKSGKGDAHGGNKIC